MKNYKILTAPDVDTLAVYLTQALNEGFYPINNTFEFSGEICQGIIKDELDRPVSSRTLPQLKKCAIDACNAPARDLSDLCSDHYEYEDLV